MDFDDNIFGNIDDGPSTHNGVSGSVAAPYRPSEGDTLANNDPHRPSEGDTPTNNDPYRPSKGDTPTNNDPPLEEGEWIDPPLEDDMENLVDSDDDLPAPTTAKEPEFNAQTDMRIPVLQNGMKFPNSKVFRETLSEYAIKKLVDIKFKLNEKKKISVYCLNECGWRCYAS